MRRIIRMMEDWTFCMASEKRERIDLPHTWNAADGQDGGNDYYRGVCVYEKSFNGTELGEDERVYLQFGGVNASTRVILNDREMCTHNNGYSRFCVDVTEAIKEDNVLRVEVDNGISEKVYPQKADFTFYGGIYRDVEMIIVSKEHFAMDYYGGAGVKVDTRVRGKNGFVRVKTYTNVKDLEAENLAVFIELSDSEGNIINKVKGTDVLIEIKNARLWKGVEDPYLYTVKGTLVRDEKVIDEVSCKCGIRTFLFDPDKGFFLNGKSYPLRGVSRHQDRKGVGNAITRANMEEDMEIIREMGANTIRLAHYQHDGYFYDLCDRYGMVVWAEIPYISAHMPMGRENTFLQMKELIIQNYNHPSIVMWGISNEITIKGKHRKDMLDNHRELQKLCKKLDPARATTLACYAFCSPFNPVTKITDIVAWNLYLGWYIPGLFLNDLFMDFYHKMFPGRCLGYSEYGAEGMPNLHAEKPRRGDHSEEYQAKYHEYMLKCIDAHPFLWGTYVWNMFDFAADARNQGGEPGMNHKGLVTFDRKTKKDSFYLYKAWWSREAFVHICGKRYMYRAEKNSEVKVYSTKKEVSLYNNGKLVGTKRGEKIFCFKVKLEDENNLVAKAGKLTDEAVIYKTDRALPEYKVKKGSSQNWV